MYNQNQYRYEPYRPTLNGRVIENLDTARIVDFPLDGTISYFPLIDNSAIVSKQLLPDGTSKLTIFKPIDKQNIESEYITHDTLQKALDGLKNDVIDDVLDEIKDLKTEIKKIKKDL